MFVLGDHQRMPVAGRLAHAAADGRQNVLRRVVDDGMHGVQPQTVDVILVDPIAGVGRAVLAHRGRVLAVEINRVAPACFVERRQVVVGKLPQVIAHRAEVVVDHVEHHGQAQAMRFVDKAAKIVGRAVQPSRRVQVHAVVAPAKLAGELGHRHHFDHRDADVDEQRQLFDRRGVGSLGRERAEVQFINHLARQRHTAPGLIVPLEGRGIDDFRQSVRSVGLPARRRVRKELLVVVQAKAIAAAGRGGCRETGEVAVAFGFQWNPLQWLVGTGLAQLDGDRTSPRRPNAKMNAPGGLNLGADWQAAPWSCLSVRLRHRFRGGSSVDGKVTA